MTVVVLVLTPPEDIAGMQQPTESLSRPQLQMQPQHFEEDDDIPEYTPEYIDESLF